MDESIDFVEYQPGHQHLHLRINGFHDNMLEDVRSAKTRDLKFRYESMMSLLKEGDVPDENAAKNLSGLLAIKMGLLDSAIGHFEEVIKEDEENVNAIQNIAHAYSRKGEAETAEKWNNQVQALLGRSDKNMSEKLINKRMAYSLAEQAFAHAYDVGLVYLDEKKQKLETAIKIYDRAFSIGSSAISLSERRRWYFIMITIFIRLDTLMMWSRDHEQARLPGFNRAINLLKEVSKSEVTHHRALAHAYLGILLERQSSFATTPMAIHDCGFTGIDSLESYSNALEHAEEKPLVLSRLAKVFQLFGKYEFALGAATNAIDRNDDISVKLLSYHCRASVNASIYMKDLNSCKMGSSTIPDRSLLEKAKEDLKFVIAQSPSLRAYMDMGQVCYYMGVDAIKESFVINEKYINKALKYFSDALFCEMGKELPELQLLRGKCMKVKGEESNALECFKKAIEMDCNNSKSIQAFRCLMETFVTWYSQGGALKREKIIDEVDDWLQLALSKYNNDVIKAELKFLSRTFTYEILELCKGTIKAGKMTLAKTYFSLFPLSIPDESTDMESTM